MILLAVVKDMRFYGESIEDSDCLGLICKKFTENVNIAAV